MKKAPDSISPKLKPVRRKQLLHQLAQEEIKAYIIDHSLKPGAPLPSEADLVRQLGIGRNSVREAVKALEALGILEVRVGSGLFVGAFSFNALLDNLAYGIQFHGGRLSDILAVRMMIEIGMVPHVIEAQTPEQLEALRRVVEAMGAAAAEGRYTLDLDEEFHRQLHENIGNSVLSKILAVFWTIYRQALAAVNLPRSHTADIIFKIHADILDALEARDSQAMRAAVQRHNDGVDYLYRLFESAQAAANAQHAAAPGAAGAE